MSHMKTAMMESASYRIYAAIHEWYMRALETGTSLACDVYLDGDRVRTAATGLQPGEVPGRLILEDVTATDYIDDDPATYTAEEFATACMMSHGEIEALKRGPGRPEIGPAIQVRLPEDLLAKVDARADAEGVSRAEMVRMLLAEALDQQVTAKARLRWEHTVYCDGRGGEYPAILIRWQDVKTFLGELHNGDPEQDERLVDGLLAAGAPDWVREAPGWVDENGWGLYSMGEEA